MGQDSEAWAGDLLVVSAPENGTALANRHSRILEDDGILQPLRGILDTKGVSSASMPFARFAALIFPIFFAEKGYVDSLNHNNFPGLQPLGWIDCVPPYDVPAGMIVMRLKGPRPRRTLGFQGMLGWGTKLSAKRKIRESLLSDIRMLMFLVRVKAWRA